MDMQQYQEQVRATAVYPNVGQNITYPTLGLCGESGEVAEKVKKIIRDKGGKVDEESREALKKELGDVMWYVSKLCDEFGFTLEDCCLTNINKLNDRMKRNKLQGSGDNR